MKPVFFSFKSLNISWFLALTILSVVSTYLLLKFMTKDRLDDREKLENIYFSVFIFGFIGARIMYVILNFSTFLGSPLSIIKISHYNLSLIGGVIGGLITLFVSSKVYKFKVYDLLNLFSPLFLISLAIGVWNFLFDVFLLNSYGRGNPNIRVLSMSSIFLILGLIQFDLGRENKYKYISLILLPLTIIIYYIIKLGLIF